MHRRELQGDDQGGAEGRDLDQALRRGRKARSDRQAPTPTSTRSAAAPGRDLAPDAERRVAVGLIARSSAPRRCRGRDLEPATASGVLRWPERQRRKYAVDRPAARLRRLVYVASIGASIEGRELGQAGEGGEDAAGRGPGEEDEGRGEEHRDQGVVAVALEREGRVGVGGPGEGEGRGEAAALQARAGSGIRAGPAARSSPGRRRSRRRARRGGRPRSRARARSPRRGHRRSN